MNKLVDSCKGCKNFGTYMCTSPKECIDNELYVSKSLKQVYYFNIDDVEVKCLINDNEPSIEISGQYTVSSHHSLGVEWTEINSGELKGHVIDKSERVQLKDVNKYYVSESEIGYGFYTVSNLVIIYFNLDTGKIAHEISPRMDYIVK